MNLVFDRPMRKEGTKGRMTNKCKRMLAKEVILSLNAEKTGHGRPKYLTEHARPHTPRNLSLYLEAME